MRHRFLRNALLAVTLLAAGVSVQSAHANPTLLFDLGTGRVLAHEEPYRRWYPASLTKLMTAYVVFRALEAGEIQLTSPISMTKRAASEPPAKMGFKPGSVMTLDNAIKMMLIKSANDVAWAIAENIGGSQKGFADRMNAEAMRLGMFDSHFVNPNGLHSPDHYSTARDIAVLVTALRTEFPQYMPYFSIEALAVGKKTLKNFNLLIGRFQGADGMKTGFICPSGYNLVATATRDGRTLVAIVLGARSGIDRAEKAADLLGTGFKAMNAGKVTLATLQPEPNTPPGPVDMRPVVCDRTQPQSEDTPVRDKDGKLIFRSAYLKDTDREPVKVAVGLGGATGPVPPAFAMALAAGTVQVSNIPIPTPRPDYPGEPVRTVGDTQAGAL